MVRGEIWASQLVERNRLSGKFRCQKNVLAKTWGVRGGGPILHNGIKSRGLRRDTTTSNRHRRPRRNVADCAETVFLDRALPSVCRTEDDTLGHDAVAHEVPQGD